MSQINSIESHLTSITPQLREVDSTNMPWGCIDPRADLDPSVLRFGIAGGVDGLAQDLITSSALQSGDRASAEPETPHTVAKVLYKYLGSIGINISNHHECAAITHRQTIANKLSTDPEAVYAVAQEIDPSVTEDQVAFASEHYGRLLNLGKIVDPHTAKRHMETHDEIHPAIDTVVLNGNTSHEKRGFIVNNIHDVAFERNEEYYEYSLAALQALQKKLHNEGFFSVDQLSQAASIRAAATKLVLPGGTESNPGPQIIQLAA